MFLGLLCSLCHFRRTWNKASKDIDDYMVPVLVLPDTVSILTYTAMDAFFVFPYDRSGALNFGRDCTENKCKKWYTSGLINGGIFYLRNHNKETLIEMLSDSKDSQTNQTIIIGKFTDGCSTITSFASRNLTDIPATPGEIKCFIHMQNNGPISISGTLRPDQKLTVFENPQITYNGGDVHRSTSLFALKTDTSDRYDISIEFIGDQSITGGISDFRPDQSHDTCIVSRIDGESGCLKEGRWLGEDDSMSMLVLLLVGGMVFATLLLLLLFVLKCLHKGYHNTHRKERKSSNDQYACREADLPDPGSNYYQNAQEDPAESQEDEQTPPERDNPYEMDEMEYDNVCKF